jgi:hypothetical protein
MSASTGLAAQPALTTEKNLSNMDNGPDQGHWVIDSNAHWTTPLNLWFAGDSKPNAVEIYFLEVYLRVSEQN